MTAPAILTLGSFDGCHLGHQALVRAARDNAREMSARTIALVLDPHPLSVLRPGTKPARLSTLEQRRRWLMAAGADEVMHLATTPALLELAPVEFIRAHLEPHAPIGMVAGPDFRFGKARAGDLETLKTHHWPAFGGTSTPRTFVAKTVEPVEAVLNDHARVPARSTTVRWLLSVGRVADAARVLGRPYELLGTVVPGDRRGRTIGFPTANLDTPSFLPADGVYACHAHLPTGQPLPAALSVGTKPTFGSSARTAEAFILRSDQAQGRWAPLPGLPEYGWTLRLELRAFVRDQHKAPSLEALRAQIERDCHRVADIISRASADVLHAEAHA
jgi:riboflavin kinase / FMN adenylyltransferase